LLVLVSCGFAERCDTPDLQAAKASLEIVEK
jgi:hypothetical protein